MIQIKIMIKLKLNNNIMKKKLVCLKLNKTILLILNLNHYQVLLLIQSKKLLMIILNLKEKMNPKIIMYQMKNQLKKMNLNILLKMKKEEKVE